VEFALEAMGSQDWVRLRTMLHPYVRWTAADGMLLRGRLNVLAMLATSSEQAAPSDYEIRDEQIYRWMQLTYDRQLLLLGSRRNEVLDLREVRRYGIDSYGDADYVSVYGLGPTEWYGKGVRLLGRTAVECTRDRLADAMGRDIAAAVSTGPRTSGATVVDLFAGSCNTLFWILRHLTQSRGLGFELDPQVFDLTRQNLSLLQMPIEFLHEDYANVAQRLSPAADQLLIAFVAPPWGEALTKENGLDLRRTSPPVSEIVDQLAHQFPNPLLFAVQVYERLDAASLAELTPRFDWSAVTSYDFNTAGQYHGLLLGTRGWRP
jgi:16S rRNA G966 N2-methylase RsmD